MDQHRPLSPAPSLAVLPFADATPGRVDDHFSDGFATEIIQTLSRVHGLKVIARASAFAFKERCAERRPIAEQLGVRYLLEGRVRRSGDEVQVSAQLIDTDGGCTPVWSDQYDRRAEEVLTVLDDIASHVCLVLGLDSPPVPAHRPSFAAYQSVLKGRHFAWRITPDTAALGKAYFEDAIEADPEYAEAYTELGVHYLNQAMFSLMTAHEAMPLTREQAERALALRSSMPEAHVLLGIVAGLYEHDWARAASRFSEALKIEPVSPWVRAMYGVCHLLCIGRAADAVEQLQLAAALDPLSSPVRYSLGLCLVAAGRGDEGARELEGVIERHPAFFLAQGGLVMHLLGEGRVETARPMVEQLHALASWDPFVVGLAAGTRDRCGDTEAAAAARAALGDGSAFGAPTGFMIDALVRGDGDAAAEWFTRAVAQRYPALLFPVQLPLGLLLRESVHWPELVALVRLPRSTS